MPSCDYCSASFTRSDNLTRHKNHHCKAGEEPRETKRRRFSTVSPVNKNLELDDDIPTFDGDEFCGNKPLTRETLNKMMKMLKIPEYRWGRIAAAELLEAEKRRVDNNTL